MPSPSSPIVLLVDDEANFLALAAEGLRSHPSRYEVETAADGSEALDTLERRRVDIVVTDLRMPGMDGFELLSTLQRRFPKLPVIVLSSYGDVVTRHRVLDSGAHAFVDKPVDFRLLTERIELLLARAAAGSLRGIGLSSFIQLLGSERKSCCLRLPYLEGKALLTFYSGELVHAEAGALRGEEAFFALLHADETPWIEIETFRPPVEATIERSLTHLLLESARQSDEDSRFSFGEDEAEWISFEATPETSGVQPPSQFSPRFAPNFAALVQGTLRRAAEIPGLSSVAVVELGTGHVLGASGAKNPEISERSKAAAELLRAVWGLRHRLIATSDFDEILLTSRPQALLLRLLPIQPACFLMMCFESANPNVGLARLELREIVRELHSSATN